MNILTGIMSTTQIQSEARRDVFYNALASEIAVKLIEVSIAAVKVETRRVDSYDDVIEMVKDAVAASQIEVKVNKRDAYDEFTALRTTIQRRFVASVEVSFAAYSTLIAMFEARYEADKALTAACEVDAVKV